jgi:hypothetical protein
MAGWYLKDPEHPERTIAGRLERVFPGNPEGNDGNDGDSGFNIRPNDPYYYVLKNQDDQWNDAVQIECEINVWPQFRTEHANRISSMASSEITASGVWVEDTGHDYKTELHPLDTIYGRVHNSMIAGNWRRNLEANGNLRLDANIYLFRFAMATDVRALFSFDDKSDGRASAGGHHAAGYFHSRTSASAPLPARIGAFLGYADTSYQWHYSRQSDFCPRCLWRTSARRYDNSAKRQ